MTSSGRLVAQESSVLLAARVESETRRGRDYGRGTMVLTVAAPDVAKALTAAWWEFRTAAGSDTAAWDMASATAEVHPEPNRSHWNT